jgi:two-component system, OmpR family, phosphate regulon sensor histidine kinase PhoR
MSATILIIAVFQGYWLTRLYEDEKQDLKKEADVLFRETVYKLQMHKFRNDTTFLRSVPDNLFLMDAVNVIRRSAERQVGKPKMVITMSNTFSRTYDTVKSDSGIFVSSMEKKTRLGKAPVPGEFNKIILRSSLGDSLSTPSIDSAYRKELGKAKINLPFTIVSCPVKADPEEFKDSVDENKLHTNYAFVGLGSPMAYQAQFGNGFNYLLGKLTYPILVSLLLITLTTATFVFLYRNLLAQRRLTSIKNDFISNITHELKTPIATVNVAIEALKSFNAIDNPQRTKEYLDISSSELQRLSLLVDKVLKLSLFENKEIELKREWFSLKQLVEEVMQTMQLQFAKGKADVAFAAEGDAFMIEADKLHITSVIYNLLDNALKYSPDAPVIRITLKDKSDHLQLQVADKGMGIPLEFQDRLFEKFFRVPQGNHHDIKGYGLGLSYVAHIVNQHQGDIEVDSAEGKGSTFIINLPVKDGHGPKITRE